MATTRSTALSNTAECPTTTTKKSGTEGVHPGQNGVTRPTANGSDTVNVIAAAAALAEENVYGHPEIDLPAGVAEVVRGYDFNQGIDYEKLLSSFSSTGFQATHLSRAINIVNQMLRCKYEGLSEDKETHAKNGLSGGVDSAKEHQNGHHEQPTGEVASEMDEKVTHLRKSFRECRQTPCTIFMAYTSNCVSSGLREMIRFIVQHNMVDVLVTTTGGIEEDFMKCLSPMYIGDFHKWRGTELRARGVNRTGNLLVPNGNYCALREWMTPILDRMLEEQKRDGINWTPSKLIHRLGKEINHPDSIYYWAYKNNIPVFSPAVTDGSIGDILFFFETQNPGFKLDIAEDIRQIDLHAITARRSGLLILGGGLVKHHVCNANEMRDGADYAVYMNTANEWDGSDAGAMPDEALSWGKIKSNAAVVKVHTEVTLTFPLLVASTFARYYYEHLQKREAEKATTN